MVLERFHSQSKKSSTMSRSLKVSVPLEKLKQAAYFHESNVLEISSKEEMDAMFESLVERAENFFKTKPQVRQRAEGTTNTPPVPNSLGIKAKGTYQVTHPAGQVMQHATGAESEPDYIIHERMMAQRVFRYQTPHFGEPRDPRKLPAANSPRPIVSLQRVSYSARDQQPLYGANVNNNVDTDSGRSDASSQRQSEDRTDSRKSKSWKLRRERRKLQRLNKRN